MVASLKREDPEAEVLPYLLSGGTDNKSLARLASLGMVLLPCGSQLILIFQACSTASTERVPLDALDFEHRVLVDLLRTY